MESFKITYQITFDSSLKRVDAGVPKQVRSEALIFSDDLKSKLQEMPVIHENLRLVRHKSSLLPAKKLKQFFKFKEGPIVDVLGDLLTVNATVVFNPPYNKYYLIPEEVLYFLGCSNYKTIGDIAVALRKQSAYNHWITGPTYLGNPNCQEVYRGQVILCDENLIDFLKHTPRPFVFDRDVENFLNSLISTDITQEELTNTISLLKSLDPDTVKLGCKLFLTCNIQAVPATARFILSHYKSAFRYVRYSRHFTSLSVALGLDENFFKESQDEPLEKCLQNTPKTLSDQDRGLLKGLVRAELTEICKPVFDSIVLE